MLIGLYVIAGAYIFYKLFMKKDKNTDDYQKLYNKILNSDEYKVKGQYEK